jgi:ribulose-5-phosphate 4-epimerase/fuculose-1-phosphate aldolase
MYGMTDLILTHLSVHLPGEGHRFLVNPYGLLFEEVTASSLVVVDAAGEPLQETTWPVNPAGFVIHSAIHIGRPDVRCVMHTHTLEGMAIATQKQGLLPLHQSMMELDGRVARTQAQYSTDATKGWLPWQALKRKLDRQQPDYRH